MIKKKYGQHFLTNKNICKKIVQQLTFKDYDNLLEIGPGKGALTEFLPVKKTTLIEIDQYCVNYIINKFPKFKKSIINKDFLKLINSFFCKKKNSDYWQLPI